MTIQDSQVLGQALVPSLCQSGSVLSHLHEAKRSFAVMVYVLGPSLNCYYIWSCHVTSVHHDALVSRGMECLVRVAQMCGAAGVQAAV